MSPFIDPVTHKKILMVPRGAKDEAQRMAQHFEPHHLETCMGGTCSGDLFRIQEYQVGGRADGARGGGGDGGALLGRGVANPVWGGWGCPMQERCLSEDIEVQNTIKTLAARTVGSSSTGSSLSETTAAPSLVAA